MAQNKENIIYQNLPKSLMGQFFKKSLSRSEQSHTIVIRKKISEATDSCKIISSKLLEIQINLSSLLSKKCEVSDELMKTDKLLESLNDTKTLRRLEETIESLDLEHRTAQSSYINYKKILNTKLQKSSLIEGEIFRLRESIHRMELTLLDLQSEHLNLRRQQQEAKHNIKFLKLQNMLDDSTNPSDLTTQISNHQNMIDSCAKELCKISRKINKKSIILQNATRKEVELTHKLEQFQKDCTEFNSKLEETVEKLDSITQSKIIAFEAKTNHYSHIVTTKSLLAKLHLELSGINEQHAESLQERLSIEEKMQKSGELIKKYKVLQDHYQDVLLAHPSEDLETSKRTLPSDFEDFYLSKRVNEDDSATSPSYTSDVQIIAELQQGCYQ